MKTTSILFYLLFFIAANLLTTSSKAQVDVNDSLTLVDFYNSTNGSNWNFNTNWLTTAPVSTWYGVKVTDNRVTTLYLSGNNLSGTIPASIGNLTQLEELWLYNNRLSGAIPASISNCTKLTYLRLYNNQLSGAIPATIGNLVMLEDLSLHNNQLSGVVPTSIGNLVRLTYFNLSGNQLSGAIPSSIGNLVRLTFFNLSDNQLSGAIPSSIGNLVRLTYLNLSGNQLSGPIPSSIGNLVKLTYLGLYNNQLSGSIPAEIGNLVNLGSLNLYNNQLSGAIPPEIGNLGVYLRTVDLQNNQLSGTIPATIGKLKGLYFLYLSKNQLSGAIPASIGNLTSLNGLKLNHNQLSGAIPASFRKLKALHSFNLSYNQLSQDQNVNFSIRKDPTLGYISNNFFTFNGLEFIAKKYPKVTYTPQANITIHQHGNTLSVYAGGTLSNNTYNWHKVGTTDSTIIKADSTFTPQQSGMYYVSVTNSVATKLTLYSDTIDFTLSPLKQSSTLITKNIQPAIVIQHMQVYPNPAKEMVQVQVKGNAMIAITNADGKVLLTKSINNSDVINVSSLAPGIYYLQNKTSGEVQKIVIIH